MGTLITFSIFIILLFYEAFKMEYYDTKPKKNGDENKRDVLIFIFVMIFIISWICNVSNLGSLDLPNNIYNNNYNYYYGGYKRNKLELSEFLKYSISVTFLGAQMILWVFKNLAVNKYKRKNKSK